MLIRYFLTVIGCLIVTSSMAAPRDIQIRHVNISSGSVELHNFGLTTESLNGWRLCTHDIDQVNRCSGSSGLNGVSIAPGESFYLRYHNDAVAANQRNISAMGGSFALPLANTAYAMQLYFPPVNFNDGNTIADHLQWNIDGLDNTSADERSDEAQAGGVWIDQTAWIATTSQTGSIELADQTGFSNHSPDNYVLEFQVPVLPIVFSVLLGGFIVAIGAVKRKVR